MDISVQFVNFRHYCKDCIHRGLSDADDPCNSCLEVAARYGTMTPEKFERKPVGKKGDPVRFTPDEPFDPNKGLEEL